VERWRLVHSDPDTDVGVCDELVWDADREVACAVGMLSGTSGGVEFTTLCVDGNPRSDVSVTLTPQNPPIVIPASGGAFQYNVAVTNHEPEMAAFDAWIDATVPSGNLHALFGPKMMVLNAGESRNRNLNQYIPPQAPAGTYLLNAHVGAHPDKPWSSDSFSFEKLP
jgi:hypothetical protein